MLLGLFIPIKRTFNSAYQDLPINKYVIVINSDLEKSPLSII